MMNKPITWDRLVQTRPGMAFEFKLLSLVDQYIANSDDILKMRQIAFLIDMCVDVLARCGPYQEAIAKCDDCYVDLKCKEITLAGYCLTVQRSHLMPPNNEFLYKIYHRNNGRNIVTSSWV